MPVQFYLFTRPDKQGDHPINVSISLFGERLCTSVGYAIAPDKWDDKTQRVKKNAYNSKKVAYNLINSRLHCLVVTVSGPFHHYMYWDAGCEGIADE